MTNDIVERLREDREKYFLDNLEMNAQIARLRAALLTCPCPGGGYTGMPKDTEPTVAACITAGVCGCIYGDALRGSRELDRSQ